MIAVNQQAGKHWHSQTLDIIDGDHWSKWVKKIGVKPFVPQPR